ncbi:MAG: hypothetical protein ACI8TA_002953 [Cyclobacteriaceae bacterium]|jgi:hypothetical protein
MITQEIDLMPATSRLWVYQADRAFLPEEKIQIEILVQGFLNQWAAHGAALNASFSIEFDQFIVIAVDESHSAASGCSIDASVGLIRNIETQFGLSLLDSTKVAVLKNEKINIYPFNAIKANVVNGEIDPDSIIFNNTVQTLGQWKTDWQQTAKSSWIGRFFG